MGNKNKLIYNIQIIADEKNDCKKALEVLQKLLHVFKQGLTYNDNGFQMEVKTNYMSSQDK